MKRLFRNTLFTLLGCISLFSIALGQDSSGVRCLSRMQVMNSACSVVLSGNVAFVALGKTGFGVIDISDPMNPVVIGTGRTPGFAMNVAVSGSYAYIADSSYGLRVYNIDSLSNLVEVSFIQSGIVSNVAILGDYLYAANGDSGLAVFDISTRDNPQLIRYVRTSGQAFDLSIFDNKIYVADGDSGLCILNLTDPAFPQVIRTFLGTIVRANKLVVHGNYVYVVDNHPWAMDPYYNEGSIHVIDCTQLATTHEVAFFLQSPAAYGSCIESIAFDNDSLYMSSWNIRASDIGHSTYVESDFYLTIFNVSDPDSLQQISVTTYAQSNGGRIYERILGLAISNGYLFYAKGSDGLQIHSISGNPSVYGSCLNDIVSTIAVSGNYAYVGDNTILKVVDISNPSTPLLVGSFDTQGYVFDIAIANQLAYLAISATGCKILNVSNPDSIYEVGVFPISGSRISISGNHAFVSGGSRVSIIDVSNPAQPTQIGYYDPQVQWYADRISIRDHYAYVSYANVGLRVLNIDSLQNPVAVGMWLSGHWISNNVISGNYAFVVTDDANAVFVVDISNPLSPHLVNTFVISSNSYAMDVSISGNYMYVADYFLGLRVINIAAPTNPHEVGFYDTPGTAYSVVNKNDTSFVGDETNLGIYDCSQALGVVDRASDIVPQTFSLKQNYPNPFNPTTTIEYAIPKTSKVELKLFDVTGREVGTLVNFNQNPGTYRVKLDASKLASGIYFYRLNAGSFSTTKKLTLIR